jgi:hypothetical protein
VPELYTLGYAKEEPYDPTQRLGPAIWLRCVVERALPEATPPAGKTPILYLPMVGRQDLRSAGECPARLQPLVELQFRGRVWHQTSGRDWTVQAFLVSDDGLGLEMAHDRRTEEAMLRVLELLADTDVASLRGRRLDADDFDKLSVADPTRDLLRWMSGPEVFEVAAKGNRWESFRNICRAQFNFDPDSEGVSSAGTALARGQGAWDHVWRRFCEAPQLYPGIAKLLGEPSVGGQGLLTLDPARNPRVNDEEERDLRNQMEQVGALPQSAAYAKVLAGCGRRWGKAHGPLQCRR